jgi:hypothetical protein
MTNLLIVGNTNTGKTSLVRKLLEMFPEIIKDIEYDEFHNVKTLWIPNYGEVNIYDTNVVDLDIFDSAIIMSDSDFADGYERRIREKCGDIPIIKLRSYLNLDDAIEHNRNDSRCCCISQNYNVVESFLNIINHI